MSPCANQVESCINLLSESVANLQIVPIESDFDRSVDLATLQQAKKNTRVILLLLLFSVLSWQTSCGHIMTNCWWCFLFWKSLASHNCNHVLFSTDCKDT